MIAQDIIVGDIEGFERRQPRTAANRPSARYKDDGDRELFAMAQQGNEDHTLYQFYHLTAGLFDPPRDMNFATQPYGTDYYGMPADLVKKGMKNLVEFKSSARPLIEKPHAALMASILFHDHSTFDMLLQAKTSFGHVVLPTFANAFGITPLMGAAYCGNVDAVRTLLSHPLVYADEDYKGDGRTAIYYAGVAHARNNMPHMLPDTLVKTLDLLIKAGGDFGRFNSTGHISFVEMENLKSRLQVKRKRTLANPAVKAALVQKEEDMQTAVNDKPAVAARKLPDTAGKLKKNFIEAASIIQQSSYREYDEVSSYKSSGRYRDWCEPRHG